LLIIDLVWFDKLSQLWQCHTGLLCRPTVLAVTLASQPTAYIMTK